MIQQPSIDEPDLSPSFSPEETFKAMVLNEFFTRKLASPDISHRHPQAATFPGWPLCSSGLTHGPGGTYVHYPPINIPHTFGSKSKLSRYHRIHSLIFSVWVELEVIVNVGGSGLEVALSRITMIDEAGLRWPMSSWFIEAGSITMSEWGSIAGWDRKRKNRPREARREDPDRWRVHDTQTTMIYCPDISALISLSLILLSRTPWQALHIANPPLRPSHHSSSWNESLNWRCWSITAPENRPTHLNLYNTISVCDRVSWTSLDYT